MLTLALFLSFIIDFSRTTVKTDLIHVVSTGIIEGVGVAVGGRVILIGAGVRCRLTVNLLVIMLKGNTQHRQFMNIVRKEILRDKPLAKDQKSMNWPNLFSVPIKWATKINKGAEEAD